MLTEDQVLAGLQAVMKISRDGSFRGAMRSAGKGFRTIQNQVKSLEEELGFLIFHRTRDGLVPTQEGRLIIEKSKSIEKVIEDIRRLGKSLGSGDEGEVTVAVTEGLGTFWISPRIHSFTEQHKNISIRLNPSMAIADMRRFDIDMALQVVEPILPDIKRVRVGTLHLMLAAAPSYIAQYGEPKSVEDLANHKFVFHTNPQSSDRFLIEDMIGQKLAQSQYIIMRNSSAHYATIEHGLGIGFIPTYGFGIGVKLQPLQVPVRFSVEIWLCFHSDSRSIPRVAKALDWFVAAFDPRLFPWFRREFVDPREFALIIENNGAAEILKSVSLRR
jgi:DNA-binding transcriptional LysR family regulator